MLFACVSVWVIGCCCFGACPPSSETYGGKGDRVAAVDRDAIILTEMSAAFFLYRKHVCACEHCWCRRGLIGLLQASLSGSPQTTAGPNCSNCAEIAATMCVRARNHIPVEGKLPTASGAQVRPREMLNSHTHTRGGTASAHGARRDCFATAGPQCVV